MRNLTSIPGRPNLRACLHREGTLDACDCLRFEAQGAVFDFPWRLELMSDLLIGIEWCGARCRCRKVMIEGIVIGCRQTVSGSFETTVLFLSPVNAPGVAGMDCVHLPN